MQDYFKINEISKLYGIGADSLRYYEEIGIIKPRRDTNRYRMYGLGDIYKLNMIRDLRKLGFTMEQIKKYLEKQSVENTLLLLEEERAAVTEQMRELKQKKKMIEERISHLNLARQEKTLSPVLKHLEERRCVQIREYITRDEEMDLIHKKLHRKYENKVSRFGNLDMGAFVSVKDLKRGVPNVYDSVFFILDRKSDLYNFVLPEGAYLSLFYSGDYEQNLERIRELLLYAKTHNLTVTGNPFEIYQIDNRDTGKTEEFLTEIQVKVTIETTGI